MSMNAWFQWKPRKKGEKKPKPDVQVLVVAEPKREEKNSTPHTTATSTQIANGLNGTVDQAYSAILDLIRLSSLYTDRKVLAGLKEAIYQIRFDSFIVTEEFNAYILSQLNDKADIKFYLSAVEPRKKTGGPFVG